MNKDKDLFEPLKNVQFVDRELLTANDYNPNKVVEKNMELLTQSILSNGFCFPIVVREDFTIIDGFHRWVVSGREPLKTLLGGKVPIVIVKHKDKSGDVFGTITFNRARGVHLLDPMEKIVKTLISEGKSIKEISKEIGMSNEEIFRLSEINREDFLKLMINGNMEYSKAEIVKKT